MMLSTHKHVVKKRARDARTTVGLDRPPTSALVLVPGVRASAWSFFRCASQEWVLKQVNKRNEILIVKRCEGEEA